MIRGKDGNVRGAVVRCFINDKHVEYERPIQRLVPFELIPELTDVGSKNIETKKSAEPESSDEVTEHAESTNPTEAEEPEINLQPILHRVKRRAAATGETIRRLTKQI